jgi:hypothetical protein
MDIPPLFIFLYYAAASTDQPVHTTLILDVQTLVNALMPQVLCSDVPYHSDLGVVVSTLHALVQTVDWEQVNQLVLHKQPTPKQWGRPLWQALWTASTHPEFKHHLSTVLDVLTRLLPCNQCKRHLTDYLTTSPFNMQTDTVENYLTQLHASTKNLTP